jgi:HAD superfamily hydrolase (TIGR01509 family)
MAPVRAVLFDLGHTLADFPFAEKNLLACYEEVRRILAAEAYRELPAASALVSEVSRRVARRIIDSYESQELQELDIVVLFDEALRAVGLVLPRDLVRQIAEMEHRALLADISVPQAHLGLLRRLRERGLKLGLVSNAALLPALMHQDIERFGVKQYMDHAVFSSEAGVRKPHPAIFQHVLNALDVPAEEAVFVGDRVHDDVGGAKKLGMRAVLTRQYRREDPDGAPIKPDLVVDQLEEVVPYVESLALGC